MPHEFVPRRLRGFAKDLRNSQTVAERELWQHLRAKRFVAFRFRRQVPMGRYVVDFVSHHAKIVIELDGPHHDLETQIVHDRERDAWLESRGYRVLRFSNIEVQQRILGVLSVIEDVVRSRGPLSQPSPARGEGFVASDSSDSDHSSLDAACIDVGHGIDGPAALKDSSP